MQSTIQTLSLLQKPRRSPKRGMTLVEVIFALGIFSMLMLGILRAFMQTRRLTEGSIYQDTAQTIVTGYMEQLKTMSISKLTNAGSLGASYAIQTSFDNQDFDRLMTSTGSPPALSTITPGTTPAGVVDNLRSFDMSTSTATTTVVGAQAFTTAASPSNWTAIWPNANRANDPVTMTGSTPTQVGTVNVVINGTAQTLPTYDYSTRIPDNNDLHLDLWVWVEDRSVPLVAANVYEITIIYTFQYVDGNRKRYQIGEIRTIRSNVPTINSPQAGT